MPDARPVANPKRHRSRQRALDTLFAADLRGISPREVLDETLARLGAEVPPHVAYAVELVEGVLEHAQRIDELISTYAEGWTIERMPPVDRNLLRIAVYEIVFRDDIDDAVAMSEAVKLAEELSTDDSPRFINGLLSRIADLT